MNAGLKIFIDALEQVHPEITHIPLVQIDSLSKPLFKQVTVKLYRVINNQAGVEWVSCSSVERITNDEEKELAINKVVTSLITKVLKSYETL